MDPQQERDLARSMEATPELLPLLPALLSDLWDLGSWPERIVEMLDRRGLRGASMGGLDLGCGKGAVAIALARELGIRVRGVDLLEAFVQDARERAEAAGLSHLCEFVHDDIRRAVQEAEGYDLVILASVGDVLGPLDQTMAVLRQCVRRGGYVVVDEGFVSRAQSLDRAGYENAVDHEEALRQIRAHGDTLVEEVITPDEDLKAMNQRYMTSIRRRAQELIASAPQHEAAISWYLDNQERECATLEAEYTGATWLLRRS